MANALAALGRSNAMQNTMGMLGSISAYKQGEARIAVNEEIAEKMKRQAAVEEEARVKAKKLNPVAGLASRFRGGENSTNWKMALEIATSKGMINNDSGQPAISNEDEGIMGEFLGTPAMQRKIQANKISDIENEMKALKSQEAEGEDGKPGKELNPKQKEQYAALDKERIAAYADNIALVQYQKSQYDKANAAILADEKAKAEKKKADALAVHQIAERLLKEGKEGPLTFEQRKELKAIGPDKGDKPTKEEKKLKDIKIDFKYNLGQYNSASRGVGQFVPDENKEKVAEDSFKRMQVLAQQYKDSGGDLADLGLDVNAEKGKEKMPEMPSAKDHKGKTIRDTQTNKRYKSDGKDWIEIKE